MIVAMFFVMYFLITVAGALMLYFSIRHHWRLSLKTLFGENNSNIQTSSEVPEPQIKQEPLK